MYFALAFTFCVIVYGIATFMLFYGWLSIPTYKNKRTEGGIFFSVIVAARNEQETILALLKCLNSQYYRNFEVIVVNDHSTDGTLQIIESAKNILDISVTSISLLESEKGKKAAISKGISMAKGKYIIATDADCLVEKNWLTTFAAFIEEKKSKLISAPVTLDFGTSLFENIQTIEFISLIGSGAVFMYWQKPNMCNGANICYQKEAFIKVNGFEGNEQLASGDDEFLMHKIAKLYPNKVHFLKAEDAIVRTSAKQSIKAFFFQRKRWASKWKHYRNKSPILVALIVFTFHLVFCLMPLIYLIGLLSIEKLIILYSIKLITEYFFIASILKFTRQLKLVWLIPLVSLFHSYYVVLIGIVANFGSYKWKGRTLT